MNENALQDDNRNSSLIVEDSTGSQTMRLRGDSVNGGLYVNNLGGQGLIIPEWDYMTMALSGTNTIETYTFYAGGTGGTEVSEVVVTYTDSTRATLVSVLQS